MELVYLWVEDYKNIQKQGFNFSSKFICDYDEIKNELTIEDNPEHIPNFFGENINVTAIVGKNGSGKSSILNAIRKGSKIGFLIFYNKVKKVFHIKSSKIQPSCNYSFDNFEYNIYYPLFDYSLSYEQSINDNEFRDDSTIEIYSTYPNKHNGKLNFIEEIERNQKNIIYNYLDLKEQDELKKFENFFQPDTLEIYFNLFNFKTIKNEEILKKYYIFIEKLENAETILDAINIIDENQDLLRYEDSQHNLNIPKTNIINFDERAIEILGDSTPLDINGVSHTFNGLEHGENDIWDNPSKKMKIINKNLISKIEYEDHDEILEEIYNDLFLLFKFNINDLNKNDVQIISSSFYSKYFIIEIIDKKQKKLSDLSFGEQQLVFILNQLYFLRNKEYDELDIEVGLAMHVAVEYIILLDEIDIGFHPDWQKRTIQYIIDFLKLMPDREFHLFFTTHSPFLLSDIPKENILFLNKKSSIKQTFGANIHTLLSDSFFMEDGLMGEFAKQKINEIIAFFNNENELYKNDKDKLLKIINTIGEPFLKDKLLFMYNEKYPKTDDEKILELEKQIESIKNG